MVTIKSCTGMTAEIDELGAQLCRLFDDKGSYIYDNMEIWPKHSPVLFPFVGRMPNQQYTYKGKSYSIPLHGFAPTSVFDVVEVKTDSATFRLSSNDATRAMYPFEFDFIAQYTLNENTLNETFTVVNKGSEEMFYGFGSHPGFNVPVNPNLKFEDYYVEFPDASDIKHLIFNQNYLLTEKTSEIKELSDNKINLKHNLFDNDAILMSGTGNRAVIKTDKDSKKIIVNYPDTPYCALWHKVKMEVPFVCIEPWVSLPGHDGINDISEKPDFMKLLPGEKKQHKLLITIAD